MKIHLIGAGGSGMLPLALLLKDAGHMVSGSDDNICAHRHSMLTASGISLFPEADTASIGDCTHVVFSPAVPETHPQKRAANRAGRTLKARAECLSDMLKGREIICVAGSHGKSTTTAMLMEIMAAARGHDFGYMLGASYSFGNGRPARLGVHDSPFVMEACEAYGALKHWRPTHAILTNIDDDHIEHYATEHGLTGAFANFLSQLPAHGVAVICGDNQGAQVALRHFARTPLTYGFEFGNRLRADTSIKGKVNILLDDDPIGELKLGVPGRHNQLNALGALGMALSLGINYDVALETLSRFKGVNRRLQRQEKKGGPNIIDDFAHHPSEIAASINAVREGLTGRLIAVLEPQLHSRATRLAAEFGQALSSADMVYILPVAGLGEPLSGLDGNHALAAACSNLAINFNYVDNLPALVAALSQDVHENDTILVMAGHTGEGYANWINENLNVSHLTTVSESLLQGRITGPAQDILSRFSEQALTCPQAIAVEMGHRSLTYGQLAARVSDLANMLTKVGVKPQDTVGVCLGRSVDRVTAFLATLRLEAVFLPLDPALPPDRLEYMMTDSAAHVVIVNASSPALPSTALRFVNCGNLPVREANPDDFIMPCASPLSLAYIIYTSGTTGKPKGVQIQREALANYAAAAADHFGITKQSRFSQVSGFGFDVSVGDMAAPIISGACLVFPTDIQTQPGPSLGRFIAQTGISHLSLTPSALSVIPVDDYPQLTHIIVAGEACHSSLIERWAAKRCFINAYGPTEATIEATFAICRPGEPVTIGRPFDNICAYVLNSDLRLAQPGEDGELYLSGTCLAKGYRNLPALTAERFPVITLGDGRQVRAYKTGDRVRTDNNGNLLYLSRIDDQMKFHGYRIEPGDIESALCNLSGILDATVSVYDDGVNATPQLIAHIVLHPNETSLNTEDIRKHMYSVLPRYMVPSIFLPVHAIPRTTNGKRDRDALPVPPQLAAPRKPRTTGNPTEERLMRLIGDHIGHQTINGTRDSLIASGVDSLTMAELIFSIEDHFGIALDAKFEEGFDTVEVMALMIESQKLPHTSPSPANLSDALIKKITPHLATWPGKKFGKSGLVRCLNPEGALPPLFWCFQSAGELTQLSQQLSGKAPLYGLRSGHLAFEYSPENLCAIAESYSDEIEATAPHGKLFLGGNCQGGMIMRRVGLELIRRGRDVALNILMEQGRFMPYPGKVLLLFGARSYLNPYGQIDKPEAVFQMAFPGGHRVEIIPGGHGQYFATENVQALGEIILRHMNTIAYPFPHAINANPDVDDHIYVRKHLERSGKADICPKELLEPTHAIIR